MEPADFIELARTIILGYGGFKLTEFMVFFQRFKQGLYGTFYGVFDPMVINKVSSRVQSRQRETIAVL